MDISNKIDKVLKFVEQNNFKNDTVYEYKLMCNLISKDAAILDDSCIFSIVNKLNLKYLNERQDNKITLRSFKMRRRILSMITELEQNNNLLWHMYSYNNILSELNQFYKEKMNLFFDKYPKLKRDFSCLHTFLCFLQDNRFPNFLLVNSEILIKFITFITQICSSRRIESYIRIIKLVKSMFEDDFLVNFSFDPSIFAQKQSPKMVYKPFCRDDVIKILESIDTTDRNGMRDFAIILLGCCLGLRAGDITTLKLTDFNWKDRELHFIQNKTGKQLSLPLDNITGDAVAAYILNGRPICSSNNVFVRYLAPCIQFKDGVALASILKRRMRLAGIKHENGDGKSFHGLRRFIATEMVKNDIDISLIVQILGHSTNKSTMQYIGLDIESLRRCALDLI
jgi:integrase